MNVTPEVLDWVRKAEDDLTAAHRLATSEYPLPDQMGFFCQQAAEKYLKAFLMATGLTPPRIHDIDALVDMCATIDPAFSQLTPLIEGLTEFAVIYRYPGEHSDTTMAQRTVIQANQVRTLVQERLYLESKDAPTSNH